MASKFETLAKTAKGIAHPFLDQLEPVLIYHDVSRWRGINPEEFRCFVLYWERPSVDAASDFLDALREISEEEYQHYIEQEKGNLSKFLLFHFDKERGGFHQYRARDESPPAVYPTAYAINVARHLAGVDNEEPLGYQRAIELLGAERVNKAIYFLTSSQDSESGGFSHDPEIVRDPTFRRVSVWNTRHAFSSLWNLERDGQIKESVRDFLFRCLRENSPVGIGFSESSRSEFLRGMPSSDATCTALKILEKMGEQGWIREHRSGLVAFLRSCWSVNKKGLGGFSHIPEEKSALLYTNAVLSSLEILKADLDDLIDIGDRQRLIDFYTENCQSREEETLSFGFAKGWRPNIFMMADTIRTLKLLAPKYPEFGELFNSIFGDKTKTIGGIYRHEISSPRGWDPETRRRFEMFEA